MSKAAQVYAQGLYSLAQEENLTKTILEEMTVLRQSFSQEPMFLRLLSAPNVAMAQRIGIIDDSFRGKVHPYVLNFLKLLTEKGYIRKFPECCEAYRRQYNQDNDILPVWAVTAVPLRQEQSQKLCEKLTKLTGKTVELNNRIDPEVLGGVRLDYDGKRIDGTVKNRLDSVRELLHNTVI